MESELILNIGGDDGDEKMEIDEQFSDEDSSTGTYTRPHTAIMKSLPATPEVHTFGSTEAEGKSDGSTDTNGFTESNTNKVKQDDPNPTQIAPSNVINSDGEDTEFLVPIDLDHEQQNKLQILVPVKILGSCVDIRFDKTTKSRAYYNHYYLQSIQLTKNKEMWEKVKNDSFGEDEDPAELVEITIPSTNQLIELYKSLNLYNHKLATPTMDNVDSQFRLDCVLIRGVTGLSTNDIFLYLRTYKQLPIKLEWINDTQCIAVFSDKYEAGRCILDLSKRISKTGRDKPENFSFDSDYDLVDEVPYNWIEISIPPSHAWRFTVASFHDAKEKPGFLLTYPKQKDKKQVHAEALSEYYREHGNPNWNEKPSIWTKGGFERKMVRKRKAIETMEGKKSNPEAPPTLVDDPTDGDLRMSLRETRVPIKSRLGNVRQVKSEQIVVEKIIDEDHLEEDIQFRTNRRVTLVDVVEPHLEEKEESDEEGQIHSSRGDSPDPDYHRSKRSRGGNYEDGRNWRRSTQRWNGYQGGMVADAEEARNYPPRNSRNRIHYRGRGSSGRNQNSANVRDRIGW